jgi:glycerol uptake facilitator-like aquaporin
MSHSLGRRVCAEFIGTAFLVAAVIGSGIMGERLAAGNIAIALLANTIATGAALVALIATFGPISGAHLNPVVSLAAAIDWQMPAAECALYVTAQIAGGVLGAAAAHAMFGLPYLFLSQHARSGMPLALSEFMATFGLVMVIRGSARVDSRMVAFAVGAYITAAYWFTSSTSFANPAVTIARAMSDTFAGIRPADVPIFLVAQALGGLAGLYLFRWLRRSSPVGPS